MKLPAPLSPTLFSDPSQSPTERFLRSGPAPEAVRAALEGGWLQLADLMATHRDRPIPALVAWANETNFVSHASLSQQGIVWPREPGDERSVDWGALRGNGEHTAQGLQAEWLVGWCVSQIAPGGLPSWPANNPHHAAQGFRSHLLGLAVQNRWVSVVDQVLSRSDRLPVETWNKTVGPMPRAVRTTGQSYVDEHHQLPVLHLALEGKNHAMIRRLLEAGLDANQVDAFGLPAVYRAKDVESVELLLQYGLNPHQKPTHGESLVEWWTQELKSTEEAVRLMRPINQWLLKNEDPEQTRLQRLPDVARLMVKGTLTALKKELSYLKVPADATWNEDGQSWSLARRALSHHLERSPVIGQSSAALDFSIARGPLGEPLVGQAPNTSVLWLVGKFNRASSVRLEKEFSSVEPTEQEFRALGEGLMDWRPPAPKSLMELPKTITKERLEWVLALGTLSLFQVKAFENCSFEDHPAPPLWAFVRKHTSFMLQPELVVDAMSWSLSKAKQQREAGCLEEAGQWLAEAFLMLGSMRPNEAAGQGGLAKNLVDREANASVPGVRLVEALEAHQAAGGRIGNPVQIQHLDSMFERIGGSDTGSVLLPFWRQARLERGLEEAAAPARRPRM
jgi:hypothetical protein